MDKQQRGARRWLAIGIVAVVLVVTVLWMTLRPSARDGRTGEQESDASAATTSLTFAPTEATPVAARTETPLPERHPILLATSTDPRAARIRVGAAEGMLAPNAHGEYPRLSVPASSTVLATVPFSGAGPGEHISIQAEDGGIFRGDDAARGFAVVGEDQRVSLEYQSSAYDGLHRVTLRRGGERRVLQFWIGPEPPVLVRQ